MRQNFNFVSAVDVFFPPVWDNKQIIYDFDSVVTWLIMNHLSEVDDSQ